MMIVLSGVCMAARFSFARMRKKYIEDMNEENAQMVSRVIRLYDYPSFILGVCQVSFVLLLMAYSFCVMEILEEILALLASLGVSAAFWEEAAAGAVTVILAAMIYWIFSVQIPASRGLVHPLEELAGHVGFLHTAGKLLRPLVRFGTFVSGRLLRLQGIPVTNEVEFTYSEDEIREFVAESHRGGKISALETLLIKNSFDFFDLVTQEIMVPRGDMVVLDYDDDMDTLRKCISKAKHTCYPLCMEDKDHIIGYIHVKDFLESYVRGDKNVKNIIRDILIVPEVMPTANLLQLMRSRRIYLAVVVDEYGGTSGLVSLQDIIEELVGEMQNETDTDPHEILPCPDGTYEFDGTVILDDVEEILRIDFRSPDTNTIGGYVFSQLERIPKAGDTVTVDKWCFTVLRMQGFRILRVKASPISEPEESGEEEENS